MRDLIAAVNLQASLAANCKRTASQRRLISGIRLGELDLILAMHILVDGSQYGCSSTLRKTQDGDFLSPHP